MCVYDFLYISTHLELLGAEKVNVRDSSVLDQHRHHLAVPCSRRGRTQVERVRENGL